MFTGIVKGTAVIREVRRQQGLFTLTLDFPADFDKELETGASVAVDGTCLTVTRHAPGWAEFDVLRCFRAWAGEYVGVGQWRADRRRYRGHGD